MSIYIDLPITWTPDTKIDSDCLNKEIKDKLDNIDAQFPAGMLQPTARASAPTGWLLCQGQAISRVTYADLFTAISTKYGVGDGSTTFNVPNMKGRVPVGLDPGDGTFNDRGKTGGSKTHTLTTAQMPSHAHGGVGNHTHTYQATAPSSTGQSGTDRVVIASLPTYSTGGAGAHGHPASGGGAAHNNLPPYLIINWLIKT